MFMTNQTLSDVKKHFESTKPESHQTAEICFLFSFVSSEVA